MSPGTRTRILPRSVTVVLYLVQLPPHFDRVSEKNNGWFKCYEAKSVIFSHFRAFWGFFSHKRAPGDATRIIFKNPRMLHFRPYKVVTPCKISEKYNGQSLRILGTDGRTDGRTHARTRVNSKVPIPTKVGGPTFQLQLYVYSSDVQLNNCLSVTDRHKTMCNHCTQYEGLFPEEN